MIRMLYKCIMFIIVVVLSIIVSPIVILIAIYQITFGKGGIKIPHKIFEMSKLEG